MVRTLTHHQMSFASSLYNVVFRRNAVFVGSIFATAFVYDIAFHNTVDKIFDSLNKGKQWKDIRGRYITADDEEE
ncbi:Cytochrome b-c1 complex subunit 9 [Wickerhamiella sorbophila]|uniref:Complex III subunit 9 n=1 Tax=Wickerhamiella sorbophila TaxID=45607 RepID=A0A2T0FPH6_9ASCO|nr:Cytochrome b-c1 complex subunit 9 [Wickerhamiella sorbophila]PRT56878.1 Cytochrome b-c1 complex subunit 9 [Wickerhamiella sorbophila]